MRNEIKVILRKYQYMIKFGQTIQTNEGGKGEETNYQYQKLKEIQYSSVTLK